MNVSSSAALISYSRHRRTVCLLLIIIRASIFVNVWKVSVYATVVKVNPYQFLFTCAPSAGMFPQGDFL